MFIKSLRICVIALTLCVANAWASPTSLEGTVKAPDGRPVSNADVRIEAKDASRLSKTVKTDAEGQYVCNGLTAGNFRVRLVVNGAVHGTVAHATTALS